MPCNMDYMEPSPKELKQTKELRKEYEALGNLATADSDALREFLLGNLEAVRILSKVNKSYLDQYYELHTRNQDLYSKVQVDIIDKVSDLVAEYQEIDALTQEVSRGRRLSEVMIEKLESVQTEHREQDLLRLMRTFAASADRERLRKVLQADNSKPLEAQLGFDPDAF